ncbi:unnamed protein product [Echinostoma caproni]|uniref:Serine/threonine-protein phosphatase 2A regulatory subunit B'' subunit gamma n=1 Tax=Echinostoma caproni TaxID=27848 RepID=A0A183BA24_9TREM|nr:unnamed protein product [Echinostoma caproni]
MEGWLSARFAIFRLGNNELVDRLFKDYYTLWGGEQSNLTLEEQQLPGFFQRVPQDHEILPQKLREEARAVLLERKSHELLENEELQCFWFLLDRFQSPPAINGEKYIDYQNFKKAAAEAIPKAKPYFTASVFAKLMRNHDRLSRISIMSFFNYVMKKVWLQQTRIGISLYDVAGEGYLREMDLENYITELIPSLCQLLARAEPLRHSAQSATNRNPVKKQVLSLGT